MLSRQPPHLPLPLPVGERKGVRGKVRALGVLCVTGTETGATRFHHGKETPPSLEPF